MLGNTNVKDGINLNATVVTKEVESGQNIVAGNFVQYKTVPTSFEVNMTAISGVRVLSNGYAVIWGNNALKLLKLDGINSETVDSLSGYTTIYSCDTDSNNNIFVVVNPSSSTTGSKPRVASYYVDTENDKLVRRQILTLENYGRTIYAFDDYLYVYLVATTGNPKPLYISVVSNTSGAIANVSHQDQTSGDLRLKAESLIKAGNKLVYHEFTNGYSTWGITGITGSSTGSVYSSINTGLISGNTVGDYANDDYLIGINTTYSGLYVYDITNNSINLYSLDLDFTISSGNVVFWLFDNNIVLLSSATGTCFCEIDHTLRKLKQISNNIAIGVSYYSTFCDSENVFKAQSTPTYIDVYDYASDFSEVSQPQEKNYVRNWDGNYQLIGVAKQSGTAGDTIEVYIPSV